MTTFIYSYSDDGIVEHSWYVGKLRTLESRVRQSAAQLGHPVSPETRAKISATKRLATHLAHALRTLSTSALA